MTYPNNDLDRVEDVLGAIDLSAFFHVKTEDSQCKTGVGIIEDDVGSESLDLSYFPSQPIGIVEIDNQSVLVETEEGTTNRNVSLFIIEDDESSTLSLFGDDCPVSGSHPIFIEDDDTSSVLASTTLDARGGFWVPDANEDAQASSSRFSYIEEFTSDDGDKQDSSSDSDSDMDTISDYHSCFSAL